MILPTRTYTVYDKNGNVTKKYYKDGTRYAYGHRLISSDDAKYVLNAHGDVVALLNDSGDVTKPYDFFKRAGCVKLATGFIQRLEARSVIYKNLTKIIAQTNNFNFSTYAPLYPQKIPTTILASTIPHIFTKL